MTDDNNSIIIQRRNWDDDNSNSSDSDDQDSVVDRLMRRTVFHPQYNHDINNSSASVPTPTLTTTHGDAGAGTTVTASGAPDETCLLLPNVASYDNIPRYMTASPSKINNNKHLKGYGH